MAADFCPRCGTARVGDFRYCRGCQLDFETLAPAENELPNANPYPAQATIRPDPATTPTPPGMSFSAHYAGTRYSANYVEPPPQLPVEERPDVEPSARPGWLPLTVALVWAAAGLLWVIAGAALLGVAGGFLPHDSDLGALVLAQGLLSLALSYRITTRPTRAAFDASAAWGILSLAGALFQGGAAPAFYLAVVVMGLVTVLSLAGRRQTPGRQAATKQPGINSDNSIGWAPETDTPRPSGGRKTQVLLAVLGVLALLAVVSVMPGAAPRAAADPAEGTIVFGSSWDPTTGILQGQRTTASVGHDTAYVVHPTRTVTESLIRLSITINGLALPSSSINVTDPPWELFGGTLPGAILYEPGQVIVRISDVGNTTLAQATLTVTP